MRKAIFEKRQAEMKENLGKSKAKVQTRSMLKELVKETTRLAKIQELTNKNSGKARTRSVLKSLVKEAKRRTPTKPSQPLQTTDISLSQVKSSCRLIIQVVAPPFWGVLVLVYAE